MSNLTNAFSFRLSDEEKSSLNSLAHHLGCKRGAALRYLLRQQPKTTRSLGTSSGLFATRGGSFQLRLRSGERVE